MASSSGTGTRPCPHCATPGYADDPFCLYCGIAADEQAVPAESGTGHDTAGNGPVELARLSMAYSDAVISTRMVLEGESGKMLFGDISGAVVVARYMDEPVWTELTEAIKAVLGDA